jgi:hypothetical protein
MKKVKYYYNTNSLRYEKLETPLRVKLLGILGFLSAALVTAIIIVSIAYRYFPSANEKRLQQQNEVLRENYLVLDERAKKLQDRMKVLEERDNKVYRAIFEAKSYSRQCAPDRNCTAERNTACDEPRPV